MKITISPLIEFLHHYANVLQVHAFLNSQKGYEHHSSFEVELVDHSLDDLLCLVAVTRRGQEAQRMVRLLLQPRSTFLLAFFEFNRLGRRKAFELQGSFLPSGLSASPLLAATEMADTAAGWLWKQMAPSSQHTTTYSVIGFDDNPAED